MKEFWNDKFSGTDYFYGTNPNKFLSSVYGLFPDGAKILCIAEGEGRNSVFLAQLGFKVTAVDFSEVGRKKAMELAEAKNVTLHYELSSLEDYDFGENKWDAIVSIFCHLPPSIRPLVHRKIEVGLKQNGILILEAYNPKQLEYGTGGPKDVSMLYTPDLLRSDFKGLYWPKLENRISEIFEGQGHSGMSSLLSGIALKK